MNIFQLTKFNTLNTIKNLFTYIGLILVLIIPVTYVITQDQHDKKVSGDMILTLGSWLFAFWGVMLIIATLVRDVSQGTIQLYLNSYKNRIKYFIAQFISTIINGILVFISLAAYTLIMQSMVSGKNVSSEMLWKVFGLYILLFLFYGLFLLLITLLVKNSALVFSVGVFLMLIIPIATNLVPLIPEYGDEVKDVLKYIPFNFLINHIWQGDFKLNNWQIFTSIASIIVLFIIDLLTIVKKDY
ncbi:phenol-soluble modulin export ABC transporter permease subunit PmtD [Staphylococcus warneri]|uniref:phenol-soluble modulin export ABC transporter permease subunit PmtD n=1 Tax=Staphylococcus warneri TaxID=1292 RepID=UPI003CE72CEB